MAADDLTFETRSLSEEDELYLMTTLYPRETGLPRVVWVSPRGGARHDARVKVSATHGDQFQMHDAPVFTVRPKPQLIHGELSAAESRAIADWIALNEDALIDYWEARMITRELMDRLQSLPT